MNWSVIGLIVDILGVVTLFIGTEVLNRIILNLLQHFQFSPPRSGALSEGFHYILVIKKKKLASVLSLVGLILLIIGFAFQLIGSFYKTS